MGGGRCVRYGRGGEVWEVTIKMYGVGGGSRY